MKDMSNKKPILDRFLSFVEEDRREIDRQLANLVADKEDINDAIQSLCVNFIMLGDKEPKVGDEKAFFFTCLRNQIHQDKRKANAQFSRNANFDDPSCGITFDQLLSSVEVQKDPSEILEDSETIDELEIQLDKAKVDSPYREMFIDYHIEGLTGDELSKKYGKERSHVYVILHRILNKLKRL